MTGEEERARVLSSAIPNRTDSGKLSLPLFPPVFSSLRCASLLRSTHFKVVIPCTPRHEKEERKPMHCERHSSSPCGHPEGGPPKLRASCSLPGPRWSRLGRWDVFVTHRPLNPHCRVQANPNLAVWRWCEHGHSSPAFTPP